ncbi:YycH family regulatory protein [Ornithinibacillus halophilus]|uniref:Two-component signal transduction system YycFG, regulatory protein YycH n=1 Tax=Ornithinibacillus halophilus TaxID=930117 RepID=A0A1M5G0J7_9BACI|nr:two-component system activity regulator YycH [Ornithinibacillus halophilus]SHF97320.1 Two-component signal transduction system YycFG, regulatory protein YycH [Ornithinibacillus halophilus]
MKLEVVKSYVLVILVGISLILTFALWTYQPNEEYLDSADYVPEEEFNLGGEELSIKDIVAPNLFIFHKYNKHYGFLNPVQQSELYEDMQSWTLYEFREEEAKERPQRNHFVEVIYPIEIPMDVVPSLFSFNNLSDIHLPDWSFQRVYILFESDNILTIRFLSIDERRQVEVNVTNGKHYDNLWSKMATTEDLASYISYNDSETNQPIYVPSEDVELYKYSLTIQEKSPSLLEHALFNNPSEVIRNISPNNEAYYQDGSRTMRVFPNELSMEYVNPKEVPTQALTVFELLDLSINNINGYKGWINDYQLSEIDRNENLIRYRMHHEGYPVFHNNNLDMIEQQWRNTQLYQQISPLYTISNSFPDGEKVTLPSGREVLDHLMNTNYELGNITDIQVGYKLYEASQRYRLLLTPTWYMKYDGKWIELIIDEIDQSKGVS